MIKFFRKIRHRLLTDNKFSKYLLYSIGEIVLVVIGILIALSINNWNEERLVRHQIKTNLINLSVAIKQDFDLLNIIEESNDFRSNSILQILKWTELPLSEIDIIPLILTNSQIWNKAMPEKFNPEFFEKTFFYLDKPRKMIVQSYAMEELKSSGLYSQLNNQQLKNLLNEYYTGLKWFFGNDEFSKDKSITDLEDYVRDNYNLTLSDVPLINEPIEVLKKDLGLIVRLRGVRSNADWRIYGTNTSIIRAEVLLHEIQIEINKL
jgi:hypothetical protein